MQTPVTSLSQASFNGAGVLPYTRWKSKQKGGNAWFLLSKESFGKDKNTYDGFSGKRDHGERHPVITASREFAEESFGIIGDTQAIKQHIDLCAQNTLHIIHNSRKNYVTYITRFEHNELERLAIEFYRQLPSHAKSEKNSLRWVKWADIEDMIKNSKPGQAEYVVKAARVNKITGKVFKDVQRNPVIEYINIRPLVVSMLRPFFQNQPYNLGKDPKIRFYN